MSGYPNPYGQPLPSPVRSPGAREWKDSRATKDYDRVRDKDRERDRDGSRHRRHRSKGKEQRDRDREREAYQKSSRWKENLTAAGIGGAAVSLLTVLSEAAEGL